MRRRSLFAGLAGLLAAPKVAAGITIDVPAGLIQVHDLTKPIMYGRVRGIAAHDLSHRAQFAFTLYGDDAPEVIVPLTRGAAGAPHFSPPAAGGPTRSSVAQPIAAPPAPIAITWSGYADEMSAPPAPPEAAALAGGAEGTSALAPPAALPSGSFHARHPGAGAAPLASESHPEK